MKQIPLPIGIAAARSFENFVVGANAATVAHLALLQPGAAPVYLWGPSGSGKTHLLQALIRRAQAEGAQTASFGAGDAMAWPFDEQWRLIVIDDCERLAPEQQHWAFALFAQAVPKRATIVAAGRQPPVDMPLREDLRSRLGWGHVMGLQALSEAEARAALRRDADRRGILLCDDVLSYLLLRR